MPAAAFAEAMLGKAVIVVEGLTEQIGIWAVAAKMEGQDSNIYPLDLSGVTIFSSTVMEPCLLLVVFSKNIGLKTYAFYDLNRGR